MTVDVHSHADLDETIVFLAGEGYYLHGATPEGVVKTPFTAPCLLYLPAGEFHRVVITSEAPYETLLTYSLSGAAVPRFEEIASQARHATVEMGKLALAPL